jgi:hypothetical protein
VCGRYFAQTPQACRRFHYRVFDPTATHTCTSAANAMMDQRSTTISLNASVVSTMLAPTAPMSSEIAIYMG